MIEGILRGDPEDLTDDEKAAKYQVMAVTSTFERFCINCHEEGHRVWECPNKRAFKKPLVRCTICGEVSHPAIDCPMKREGTKKQTNESQKELIDFISGIESDLKDNPLPSNPLSFMNFVTNFDGKTLQLMNSAANAGQASTGNVTSQSGSKGPGGSYSQNSTQSGRVKGGLPCLPAPPK